MSKKTTVKSKTKVGSHVSIKSITAFADNAKAIKVLDCNHERITIWSDPTDETKFYYTLACATGFANVNSGLLSLAAEISCNFHKFWGKELER